MGSRGALIIVVFVVAVAVIAAGAQRFAPVLATACTAEPRSFDEIERLRASPAGQIPFSEDRTREVPATAATTGELETVVVEFLRCSAAGEPLRVWRLYSDPYLTRLLSRERGYDRARYDADTVPKPLAAESQPLMRSFSNANVFASGRSMARVVIFYPNLDREKVLQFWFVRAGGIWRIDEIQGEITFAVS